MTPWPLSESLLTFGQLDVWLRVVWGWVVDKFHHVLLDPILLFFMFGLNKQLKLFDFAMSNRAVFLIIFLRPVEPLEVDLPLLLFVVAKDNLRFSADLLQRWLDAITLKDWLRSHLLRALEWAKGIMLLSDHHSFDWRRLMEIESCGVGSCLSKGLQFFPLCV